MSCQPLQLVVISSQSFYVLSQSEVFGTGSLHTRSQDGGQPPSVQMVYLSPSAPTKPGVIFTYILLDVCNLLPLKQHIKSLGASSQVFVELLSGNLMLVYQRVSKPLCLCLTKSACCSSPTISGEITSYHVLAARSWNMFSSSVKQNKVNPGWINPERLFN